MRSRKFSKPDMSITGLRASHKKGLNNAAIIARCAFESMLEGVGSKSPMSKEFPL